MDNMLWQSNNNTDTTVVRGDAKGFGGSENSSPTVSGAPVFTDGNSLDANATNSKGAVGDTGSDPMFDRFKHFATGGADEVNFSGSNSATSVASTSIPSGSDPMFQEMPKGDGETPSSADSE